MKSIHSLNETIFSLDVAKGPVNGGKLAQVQVTYDELTGVYSVYPLDVNGLSAGEPVYTTSSTQAEHLRNYFLRCINPLLIGK